MSVPILRIAGYFISLFVVANGIHAYIMPHYGNEQIAVAIIAIGIFVAPLV